MALSAPQTDGETLSVTQRDAAGNESDPALLVAPDTTAPEAPTATIAGDGLTVTGAGEPGATVRVFGPGGALIGSATVLGDGSYTIVLDEAQTNGQMLTAIQTDNAGNASDPVGLTAPDLDAPLAPVAAITPDGAILSGTGEIGATIEATRRQRHIDFPDLAGIAGFDAKLDPVFLGAGTRAIDEDLAFGCQGRQHPVAAGFVPSHDHANRITLGIAVGP